MKLNDKVAIVTGGGQGTGEGIVICLAKEGADVAVVDINGDNAKKVAAARKLLEWIYHMMRDGKTFQQVEKAVELPGRGGPARSHGLVV